MSINGETMKFHKNALAIAVMLATSTLTACGSSSSDDPAPAPTPEPENSAPTAVLLSANTVDENAAGVTIGTLSATDANAGDTFTFTTDNADFVIDGDTLSLAEGVAYDYEKIPSTVLSVTVTDNGGLAYTDTLSIDVNDLLDYYGFISKVTDDMSSSVSYGGQSARHALIAELKHYIGNGGLQADLDEGVLSTKDEVIAKLNSLYNATENSWDTLNISFTTAKQTKFSELSSSYKSLKGKIAGNDASGQHKLWNGDKNEAGFYNGENIAFAGWSTWDEADELVPAEGVIPQKTPHGLVQQYFANLADIAIDNLGNKRYVPGAEQVAENEIPVYVADNGTDLNQLIQKFLLMSVAYSQAADDYLDENKGLATDNVSGAKEGTKAYTDLEHQFDEGYGYFGAARDYLAYSDDEIASKGGRETWQGQYDTDGDGEIDLLSEKNFGNSVNAAKRDRGSKLLADKVTPNPAATDYTKQAMEAFLNGRKLINDNAGMDLTEEQMTELFEHRDDALDAWERGVVATVIHYINDLTDDLGKLGTEDFDYATTAKHFSEMKGFALGLQFNPYSPIAGEDAEKFAKFVELHTLFKDAPVLAEADVADYLVDLKAARDLLQEAYSFDAETVEGW
jgi:hypothetical protein